MIDISELGEYVESVTIVRPDGRKLEVPMKALNEQELWLVRGSVKAPQPPFELGRWDGKDGPVTKKYDASNPTYQTELEVFNRNLSRALLLRCLDVPAGLTFKSTTNEDKALELETKLGAWATAQLLRHMNRLMGFSDAEVSQAAQNFPLAT